MLLTLGFSVAVVVPSHQYAFAPAIAAPQLRHRNSVKNIGSRAASCRRKYWQPRSQTARRCEGQAHGANWDQGDEEGVEYANYVGPIASRADMEAGCIVDNLGLEITVGPRSPHACNLPLKQTEDDVSQMSPLYRSNG